MPIFPSVVRKHLEHDTGKPDHTPRRETRNHRAFKNNGGNGDLGDNDKRVFVLFVGEAETTQGW